MPRIRIITDVGPSAKMTAGIVLENIIRNIPNHVEVDVYLLHGKEDPDYELSHYIDFDSFRKILKPNERWVSSRSFVLFNIFGEILSRRYTKRISREIIQEESRDRSDLILLAVQGQTSIRIALALLRSGYDISTIWWDSFSWYQSSKNVPKIFEREIEELYLRIQEKGRHLVPSQQFAERLGLKNNFEVFYSQYHFVSSKVVDLSAINICLVGQLYAIDEINEFLELMDLMNWNYQGKNIVLHTYGEHSLDHPMIRFHGWLDSHELIDEIAAYDLAFLPYPKSKLMKEVIETSYPSKLGVYVSAGLPVIYVGPTNSVFYEEMKNLMRLFDKNNLSVVNSNFAYLLDLRGSDSKEIYEVWRKYFSLESFQSTLNRFMAMNGIEYNLFSFSDRRIFKSSAVSKIKFFNNSINYSYYYGLLLRIVVFLMRKIINQAERFQIIQIIWTSLVKLFVNPKYLLRYLRSFSRARH